MRASAATATFSLTLRAVDSRASFWLEPGGQLWVGRHPTNDVVIDGPDNGARVAQAQYR